MVLLPSLTPAFLSIFKPESLAFCDAFLVKLSSQEGKLLYTISFHFSFLGYSYYVIGSTATA